MPDDLHFLRLVQQSFGTLTYLDLVRQPSPRLGQLLCAASKLAQIRRNSTDDPSARIARQWRERQIYGHLAIPRRDQRQDDMPAVRTAEQRVEKADIGLKNVVSKMSSADLARRSAKERREGLVAVNDQARVREGDRAIFHLLDQQAVGAVCIRDGVNMLAERPTHDQRVDFPAANDFERFLRLAKLETQVLDFGVREPNQAGIRHPQTVSHPAASSRPAEAPD